MILGTLSFDGNIAYVSTQEVAVEHFYFPYMKIDSISRRPEFQYGGVEVVDWGTVSFSTRLWDDTNYRWPPPETATLTLKHTLTNEAGATTLVSNAELTRVNDGDSALEIRYDVFISDILGTDLLKTTSSITARSTTSYEGIETPLPMAVGTVEYAKPLRLNDYGTYPCYYSANMTGTLHTDWHVYDDGVDICSNVTEGTGGTTGTGTFYLDYSAVGEVSISGNGVFASGTTISDAVDAIVTLVTGESVTVTSTNARAGDAKIGDYAESQVSLQKYLSMLCASHGHYLKFTSDSVMELTKVEKSFSPSTTTYTDTQILPVNYSADASRIRSIKAGWPYREQVDEGGRVYVKEVTREASRSNSAFWVGTATSTSTNKLIDSSEDFDYNPGHNDTDYLGGDMMRYGMHVLCTETDATTTVTAVDSGTQLSLADDIFTSTYGYEIGMSYSRGQDMSISAYSIDEDTIQRNLKFIMNALHYRKVFVRIPFDSDEFLSLFSEGIFVAEINRFERDTMLYYNKIVGLLLDFEKEIVTYTVIGTVYEENPLS